MSQESPTNDPQSPPNDPQSAPTPPAKPSRSPVERIIVWGVILVGAGVAVWEARAKFGYDGTKEKLEARTNDESGEDFKALTLGEVKGFTSGGPAFSKIEDGRVEKAVTMTWPSLFKTYKITLILGKDEKQNDDDLIVMGFETAAPPEPGEQAAGVANADGDDADHDGGGPPMGDQGGPPPGGFGGPDDHGAEGSGRSQRPGGAGGAGPQGAGGPGGRRGGGRNQGLIGLVQADDVKAELKITEDQNGKIAALQEQAQADAPNFRDMRAQMEGKNEEEQAKIRADFQAKRAHAAAKVKEGLGGILDETQMTRLQQIEWQIQGARALASSDAMAQLNLSDEQKSKMAEISEQFGEARRELGFQASAEDRAKFNEEYDAKFQDVLTDEQKQAWQKLQGEKFERAAAE